MWIPVRAACVIAGRIRNSSLKRYLRYIEELVFWMLRAKIREPALPGSRGHGLSFYAF